MRPEQRDAAYLWDMLDAARAVIRFTAGLSMEEFLAEEEEVVRLAVERELEIMGEAARRLSAQFREAHSEVPWKDIVGLRNVISHQYDKVDYKEVFRIASERMPRLVETLESLTPEPPRNESD